MAETKEQFRERIGLVGYMGMTAHFDPVEAAVDWERESLFHIERYTDAAVAAYAQALRDVLGLTTDLRLTDEITGDPVEELVVYEDSIQQLAAERGIDLDDTP